MRLRLLLACLLIHAVLTGCANTPYYLQSVNGHLALINAARPVDDWLTSAQTPPALHTRLALAQRIRRFAVTELALPDNASYQRYADLQRPAAVWNVVAAPPYSLALQTWCFPVAGCVGYRGYFAEAQARELATTLQAQGLEVSVYGVPAYSTLGWMNWAGGDPLLNTFIHYPEGELARLIFHELAHQVLYVPGDMVFNESFATAVERMGSTRWLALHAPAGEQSLHARHDARRTGFQALARSTRQVLADIYALNDPLAPVNTAQEAMKTIAMQNFKSHYAALKSRWQADAPADDPSLHTYDRWVDNANNAAFGALAAYDTWVPSFEALFRHEAGAETDAQAWRRFFAAVKQLAQLPPAERAHTLEQWAHR